MTKKKKHGNFKSLNFNLNQIDWKITNISVEAIKDVQILQTPDDMLKVFDACKDKGPKELWRL